MLGTPTNADEMGLRRLQYSSRLTKPTLSSPTREKFDIVDRPHPQTSV
jgi:hypothetical protein